MREYEWRSGWGKERRKRRRGEEGWAKGKETGE
jgi:hypothetical protein